MKRSTLPRISSCIPTIHTVRLQPTLDLLPKATLVRSSEKQSVWPCGNTVKSMGKKMPFYEILLPLLSVNDSGLSVPYQHRKSLTQACVFSSIRWFRSRQGTLRTSTAVYRFHLRSADVFQPFAAFWYHVQRQITLASAYRDILPLDCHRLSIITEGCAFVKSDILDGSSVVAHLLSDNISNWCIRNSRRLLSHCTITRLFSSPAKTSAISCFSTGPRRRSSGVIYPLSNWLSLFKSLRLANPSVSVSVKIAVVFYFTPLLPFRPLFKRIACSAFQIFFNNLSKRSLVTCLHPLSSSRCL